MLERTASVRAQRPQVDEQRPHSSVNTSIYDFMNVNPPPPPHHSGVLYLNDNFDGGDLFFTSRDAKTVTVSPLTKVSLFL